MSNWLSEFSGEEQRQVDELNRQGITGKPTQKKEVGLFDGAASSPFRGAGAGFAKVADTIAAPIDALSDRLAYTFQDVQTDEFLEPYSAYKERQNKNRDDLIYGGVEALEDKENTGLVGNIGFSLGDYATRAVVGSAVGGVPGAIAATGLSETDYVYGDLTRQGVDEATAAKVAITDGAVAAVSTALPMSYGFKGTGGIIKDGLLSVGGATALSQGGQAVSGAILDSAGYEKQAKKYEVTAESVTTDVLLNTLFFGAARGASRYLNADATPEQIEARTTQQQAALVLNEVEFDDAAIPVTPSNPIQHNNHLVNMREATESVKAGRPVKINRAVEGEEKQNPVRIAPSEYDKIRYDDPRLDSILHSKAKEMDMEWAVPLLLSIRRAGEKSHNWQVSPVGAQSIMQIMPETKAGLERNYKKKWDINNPEHATEMALYLVREMSQQYKTKDPLVLAAHYNGGFANGKAMQKNGKPKAQETINYVNRVKDFIGTGKYKNYTGNNITTAHGMDGSSYDVAFEVKSLGDLIASNDLAYGVNPLYPAELQPRDRTREASRQQIESMANDLRPEWLGESVKLSDGAPIVGMDNVVESGNGRTLAIGKAYESGRADAYQQFVADFAASRGIDISGIDRPVLVRTRLTDTDRVQFTQLANQTDVAQFSATERAKTDADRLPDTSLIKLNADGNINLEQSMDFVRSFVSQLPKSEQASVITGDGRLSQDGKRRIKSAIAQRAYNDSGLIARLSENLDDDSKTVLNALLRAAPQLAQLNDLVKQGGRHSNTLADDLAQAAQKLSDLKANGQTVPDYLNQGQLIEDGLSDGAKAFLNVFDSNKRSAKAISDNIQSEIDRIEGMGDPRQGSLFGEELTQVKSVQDQIIEMLSNSSKYSADYINDAAKIVASVYHSTAKQMGITADELFARFPMRITDASSVESGTTFGQSNLSDQITTKSFKNWFGDSKVVDAEGRPLVVYHGTNAEFDTFDDSFFGKTDEGFAGKGFYFTNYGDLTSEYGSRQIKAYLSAKNPFITEDYNEPFRKYGLETNRDLTGETSKLLQDNLKKDGYDGVFVMDYENNAHEYIVFSPNQIKSADGNDGAFNPDNPNMYKQANGGTRGSITFNVGQDGSIITLNKDADFSTFVHELGHHFLEMHMQLKEQGALPQNISKDMDVVMDWAGLTGVKFKDLTPEQSLSLHEKFAETFEQYLSSGKAPTPELKDVFNRFKSWMMQAYKTLQSLIMQTPRAELSQDIVAVMDSMLGAEQVRVTSLFDDVLEGDAVANTIMQNPDQQISVSRMRPDGEMEEITMTLRERLDELEAEAKQAEQDTLAAQTAISCALQFGE